MSEIIISVHTPKVAGSSFLHQIMKIYGEKHVFLDYSDDPADTRSRVNIDPDSYFLDPIKFLSPYKIVHGHFHPNKYEHHPNAFRMTFLRHPVDNIISIFKFWHIHDINTWDSPVFRYFKENSLTLERLALIPKIRYLYTKSYFGGFDMNKFNFIGDYKNYDEELERLGNILDVEFDLNIKVNVTNDYDESIGSLEIKKEQISLLHEILKEDINFYEQLAGK